MTENIKAGDTSSVSETIVSEMVDTPSSSSHKVKKRSAEGNYIPDELGAVKVKKLQESPNMGYVNIKHQDLELEEPIGKGGYSSVYKAKWNQRYVAAKKLTSVDIHEVNTLSTLNHPNIVKLIGLVHEKCEMILVLELCEGGSLRSYLDELRSKGERLSPEQFLDFAQQAARPIQYLRKKNIVHKDIKSENYLLANGNVLKLADFGLAKILEHTTIHGTWRGTPKCMAPELLKEGILSTSFDINGYGVVVWELWTTELPYKSLERVQIIWTICEHNERPTIPPDCPMKIADLMRQCWSVDRKKRPPIGQILESLSQLSLEECKPQGQMKMAVPWVVEKEFGHIDGPGKLSSYCHSIAVNSINGDVAVADYNGAKVKVYSSKGEYKTFLDTKKGEPTRRKSCPFNVVVSNEGCYYVTDCTRYVKMYNADGDYQGRWPSVSPDNRPSNKRTTGLHGLAIDDQQLLVGDEEKCISKHNLDGSHIASITTRIKPYFLAVKSQETIIIGDFLNKSVEIVDFNTGELQKTLIPPITNVRSWSPYGIYYYKETIYICNSGKGDNPICCFSQYGDYLTSVDVGQDPAHIAVSKDKDKFFVLYRLYPSSKVAIYSVKIM